MVVYILSVKADLQGVASLSFMDAASICLDVRQNPVEGNETREKIVVDGSELEPEEVIPEHQHHQKHPKSKKAHAHQLAKHHFALKWSGCQQKATIRILEPDEAKKHHCKEVTAHDSGQFVPIMALECQGIEPYAFHPLGDEFVVTNTAGVRFDEVDLSGNGGWSKYDLGSGSTSITNFEAKLK